MEIRAVKVTDRGATPRRMLKVHNAANKIAWYQTGLHFHGHMRDNRFTEAHAREAGYKKRKGESLPKGSKGYRRSYTGRKERKWGHTRPLEFSGRTRDAVRTARITSTSKGARVSYSGASTLNFKHPKSQIRMNEEFRTITRAESEQLGEFHGEVYGREFNGDTGTDTRTV